MNRPLARRQRIVLGGLIWIHATAAIQRPLKLGGLRTASGHGKPQCSLLGILDRHLNPAPASSERRGGNYPLRQREAWPNSRQQQRSYRRPVSRCRRGTNLLRAAARPLRWLNAPLDPASRALMFPGRPKWLKCPNLELLLSVLLLRRLRLPCLSGPADAVAELTSAPSVTIAQLARPPVCSERWAALERAAARVCREAGAGSASGHQCPLTGHEC